MAYVAVVKALYDYEAQDPEGELSFKEDQIIYVIEKEDADWWKAKLKDEAGGDAPVGLIPVTYVEEIPPINQTRALYAYESTSPDELSMSEDHLLQVYSIEDDWLLVRIDGGSEHLGFVPRTYCEPMDAAAEVEVEDAGQAAAELEAQHAAEAEEDRKRQAAARQRELKLKDKIETWAISEMEGKKKKKGTLGVGNGAVFFASDTNKSPVKQYPITDLGSVSQPSSKQLLLAITSLDEPLHFHCGSSDTAAAIVNKLEASKAAAGEALEMIEAETRGGASSGEEEAAVAAAPKAVRWAATPASPLNAKLAATVLYDFEAQGEDELSVTEGEELTVVDKENDEWWTVRNASGQEGVVPAQYVELADGAGGHGAEEDDGEDERRKAEEAAAAAAAVETARYEARQHKIEQKRAIEQAAREKEQREADDHALAVRVEQEEMAKRDRRERRREEESKRRKEEEAAQRREAARQSAPPKISKRPSAQDVAAAARSLPSTKGRSAPDKPSEQNRPKPNPTKTRVWSDKTGQFKVEAELLGLNGNKIRLHKLNGVIIEVPLEKMSAEDAQLIKRYLAKRQASSRALEEDDDVPLGRTAPRRGSSQPSQETRARAESPIPAAAMEMPKPRKPRFDWFEFFLSCGCDMDDCTRYSTNFERDRIDESVLEDLEPGTLRSLGLREGDVIRVRKAINNRFAKKNPEQLAQIKLDEDYARQLQEHENSGSKGPAPTPPPSLFTGPDGKLANNTRRGRPEKKNTGSESVDANALAAASDQLSRATIATPPPPPTIIAPPQEKKEAPPPSIGGFDDDAWTIRPSSAKPASPAPAQTQAPPPPANSTQALLSQIQNLRPASTGVQSNSTGVQQNNTGGSFDIFAQIPQQAQNPSQMSNNQTGSSGFSGNYGLGAGNNSSPMSQLLQQQTGMSNGARGPLAPVPQNAELLNPLQPTQTGMFVPTRGGQQQQQFGGMMPQQTGFMPQQQMMMQPTGYAAGFQQGYQGQQHMQPNFTGYPGGYQQQPQQSAFNAIASIPPPQPQQSGDKFAPSSIFGAMKSQNFGKPEEQQPQSSNKYDALRPLTTGYNGAPGMMPQQTGMMPQQTGMMNQQTGYGMGMMPQMTGYMPQQGFMPNSQNPYGSGYR